MYARRSFYECAFELEDISGEFRRIYLANNKNIQDPELFRLSVNGQEILQKLTLGIRREQDYGLTNKPTDAVGGLNENLSEGDRNLFRTNYHGPFTKHDWKHNLNLREALNKVAHFDPHNSGFFANDYHHELVLSGTNHNKIWICAISLTDICIEIKKLPDVMFP